MKSIVENVMSGLLESPEWEKLNKHNNNWKQDPVFKDYHKLGNKQKGVVGEFYVEKLMTALGSTVTPPEHTDHDRIIDDMKTEIKFSLAASDGEKIIKDKFIINHVAMTKDYDRLLFCCINPPESWDNVKVRRNDTLPYERTRVHFIEKSDLVEYMNSEGDKLFKHQQSGEKGGNDDYICTNVDKLIALPFVKKISDW